MAYLLVVRILLSNPFRMLVPDLHPKPISKIGMKLPIGMEAVASLNHLLGVSAFKHFPCQDLHSWEVIIECIEVFECFLSKDF